jgi:hypothetical protein
VKAFEQYADKIYRFTPGGEGILAEDRTPAASHPD